MEIERMVKRSMSMLHKEQWDAVPHLTFTYQSHSTFLNHKSRRKGSKDSRDLEWQAICINTLMNPTFYECIANTAKHHACVKKTISSMLVWHLQLYMKLKGGWWCVPKKHCSWWWTLDGWHSMHMKLKHPIHDWYWSGCYGCTVDCFQPCRL